MADRAADWFEQAERDLEQAEDAARAGRHEWACFASQQSAEKAVEAYHLWLGQEAWGHVVAKRLRELPATAGVPEDLIQKAHVLDNFYIPARYPNSHPEGRRSSTMVRSRAGRRSAMPVRSLTASVFAWPDARTVDRAVRQWAAKMSGKNRDAVRIGYFGSYARGDWGARGAISTSSRSCGAFESPSSDARRLGRPRTCPCPRRFSFIPGTSGSVCEAAVFWKAVMAEAVWVFERTAAPESGSGR